MARAVNVIDRHGPSNEMRRQLHIKYAKWPKYPKGASTWMLPVNLMRVCTLCIPVEQRP